MLLGGCGSSGRLTTTHGETNLLYCPDWDTVVVTFEMHAGSLDKTLVKSKMLSIQALNPRG